MPIPSPVTHATAGTRAAMVTSSDYGSGDTYKPELRWVNRCTVVWISGGTLYLGLQRPAGVANTVSATVYNIALSATNPSFTIGPFGEGNNVDLGDTYRDVSSSTVFTLAPLTV